jgi:DNA repair exonuclease SbcCD ATPase subunit
VKTFARNVGLALLLVGVVVEAHAAERAPRERPGHGKELQQIEQQIRAGRSVTKRIQRDPRASAEIKQKATELDQLLDARERTLTKLDALYRDFLAQHKAELDELEDLRKRALAIDGRLGDARNTLVQANRADIEDLKRNSQQARQLVETLRSAYELDRRTRRQP